MSFGQFIGSVLYGNNSALGIRTEKNDSVSLYISNSFAVDTLNINITSSGVIGTVGETALTSTLHDIYVNVSGVVSAVGDNYAIANSATGMGLNNIYVKQMIASSTSYISVTFENNNSELYNESPEKSSLIKKNKVNDNTIIKMK